MRSAPVDLLKGSHDVTVLVVVSVASSQSTYADILDYDHGTPPYGGFAVQQDENALNRYGLGWRNITNDGWVGLSATVIVPAGSRQTLALLKAGGTQRGFLNGEERFNVPVPAQMLANPPRPLVLGSFGAGGRHFRGDIAEILIYNRALSPTERGQIEGAISLRYSDSDGNGLPDTWEVANFGRAGIDPAGDADGDGLTNRREFELGTDPNSVDSDRDGLPDAWEVAHGTSPTVGDSRADPDGDGLSNLAEQLLGTRPDHPALPDTNGTINLRLYRPRN
jgi:hypothetical protein